MSPFPKVPPESFVETLAAQVDSPEINDAEFRELVRKGLPTIDMPHRPIADFPGDEVLTGARPDGDERLIAAVFPGYRPCFHGCDAELEE